LEEPAESSLPHFVGAQFSWNGLSLTCAWTAALDNAKVEATATAMITAFIFSPSPDCFWMSAIFPAGRNGIKATPRLSHSTPDQNEAQEHFTGFAISLLLRVPMMR
jgi:hypothetical protein